MKFYLLLIYQFYTPLNREITNSSDEIKIFDLVGNEKG